MPSRKKKASLRAPLQQQQKQQQKRKKSIKRARIESEHSTSNKKYRETSNKNNDSSSKKNSHNTATSSNTSTVQQQNTLANVGAIEVGSKTLIELVRSRDDLCFLGTGKVKCTITKHEMKPVEDIVLQHLQSKRYKLEKGYQQNYDYLLPWIQPNPEDHRKLTCTLTGHELNKIPSQLELHVNSKRFIRLKKEGEEKLRVKEERKRIKEEKRKARVAAAMVRKAAGENIDVVKEVMLQETSEEESSNSDEDIDSSDNEEDGQPFADEVNQQKSNLTERAEKNADFSWIIRSKKR